MSEGSPLADGTISAADVGGLDASLDTKLPLAGGTMTGPISFAAGQTWPTFNQSTTGSAATLATGRTIGMTGDVTWTSAAFNGSANVTGTATLANSGLIAGTYTKITVDAKGRATSGTTLSASDIPALDASKITTGTLDAARLPSYVDDVLEYANLTSFPASGETGKIYVALDTNKTYRWSGSTYVYITSGAVDSVAGKTGVVTLTSSDVGLGNVENKSSATIRGELTSGNVTTALGFTPYNATNPNGYITSAALSSYLPLSGGTLTGDLRVNTIRDTSGTWVLGKSGSEVSIGSAGAVNDIRFNSSASAAFEYRGNTILHAGNYTSYSPSLTGSGASGTWGITTTADWLHSDRDFASGTLITTNINYAVSSGDPFVLEIRGNSYGDAVPYDIQYQGYIYSDTIINHGGYSNGTYISGLVAMNVGGNLCFWFPRQSYWNGFNVRVYIPYSGRQSNRVSSITSTAKPSGTKEVALSANIRQSLHSSNYTSYTMARDSWNGNLYFNNDGRIYSTILYDANDSGYYIDPNSTSRLNYIVPNRIKLVNNTNNEPRWDFSAYVVEAQHWYGNYSTQTMYLGESNVVFMPDIRPYIMYDRNDTGYYCDPASTNRLNFVNSNNHYIQPGYMLYSDHGNWTGEYNKIQWHANHLYLQNAGGGYLLILRRGDGGERFYCDYNGNVTASGNITAYSDARLKTNVKTIQNARELRKKLRGVTFDWIESGKHSYGLIAQEVEAHIPELVLEVKECSTDPNSKTIKTVDYSKLVSVLIQDGNEQDEVIEQLEARVAKLEELIKQVIG